MREPRIEVRVVMPPDRDALDVWIYRYNWPEGEPAFAEVLTGGGWALCHEGSPSTPTLTIDGYALSLNEPLAAALTGLHRARRDAEERIERLVEGSVMRALAGTPAWFPLHEFPDGRLAVIVKEADE